MSLEKEIERKAKAIHTDGYPMSIGELISLYQDKEIDLHPEFQRFFRWIPLQKTRFIESILIGIPIPAIFVYQRDDGVWDVIDGVQRLSTIFEFVGILEKETGERYLPLKLEKGDYLLSLKEKMWKKEDEDDEKEDPENYFTMSQRIAFKRAKLDIKIITESSNGDARYELFKRINTGGTSLSAQEVRNFLLLMINKNFCSFLQELASYPNFKICTQIPDDIFESQYDMELVSKFVVFRHSAPEDIENEGDISDFITNRITEFAKNDMLDMDNERKVFEKTFNLLVGALKSNSFKRFDKSGNTFSGYFSIAAYEAIAIGIGANIDKWESGDADKLKSKIKSVWEDKTFLQWYEQKDDKKRVQNLISWGKEYFSYGEDQKS